MAALTIFPEAEGLIPDFFVSLLRTLSTLISFTFTFGFERDFFTLLDLGSPSELSWSLDSAFVFLRLLGFLPASGSGRAVRFFGREGAWSSSFPA
jgi:hypothetical protein